MIEECDRSRDFSCQEIFTPLRRNWLFGKETEKIAHPLIINPNLTTTTDKDL